MKEITGDLWDFHAQGHYICITTNGTVRRDGACVMGRGIAKQAASRFPQFPYAVGKELLFYGPPSRGLLNFPVFVFPEWRLITFRVKWHWGDTADMELIDRTARLLSTDERVANMDHVYLPRPGCGNGHLQWSDVRAVIAPILDDRFTVVEIHP
jgi:hypothetical protein